LNRGANQILIEKDFKVDNMPKDMFFEGRALSQSLKIGYHLQIFIEYNDELNRFKLIAYSREHHD